MTDDPSTGVDSAATASDAEAVPIDRRPTRTAATLSALVAAAVALAVGVTAGHGAAIVAGVLGAGLLSLGAWGLAEPARTRQAGGSVAATVGAVALAAAFVLGVLNGGLVVVPLALGFAVLLIDAVVGLDGDRDLTVSAALRENGTALLVGVVVASLLHVALVYAPFSAIFGVAVTVASADPFGGLVALQVGALVVGLTLSRAVDVLADWVPDGGAESRDVVDAIEPIGIELRDVPTAYWLFFAVQPVLLLSSSVRGLFASFFGPLLGPVLTSPLLHGAVLGVAVLLAGIVVAGALQRAVVSWFGDDPGEQLALQAGGAIATALALVGTVALATVWSGGVFGVARTATGSTIVGAPALGLIGLTVTLFAVVVVLNAATVLTAGGLLPSPGSGFAFGGALLFLGVLAGVAADVPSTVVFAGVAGSILAWDLGAHATSVGWQLGRAAETRRAEFVHASASALVLAGAAVVAVLAYEIVVPALAPAKTSASAGPAVASLVLVLAALLAFSLAAHLRSRADEY